MKKHPRKQRLTLTRQTLRTLSDATLAAANGGMLGSSNCSRKSLCSDCYPSGFDCDTSALNCPSGGCPH